MLPRRLWSPTPPTCCVCLLPPNVLCFPTAIQFVALLCHVVARDAIIVVFPRTPETDDATPHPNGAALLTSRLFNSSTVMSCLPLLPCPVVPQLLLPAERSAVCHIKLHESFHNVTVVHVLRDKRHYASSLQGGQWAHEELREVGQLRDAPTMVCAHQSCGVRFGTQ